MRKITLVFILGLILTWAALFVRADELDDINHQLENLKKLFSDIKKATDTNQVTLDNFNKQLAQIKVKVVNLEEEIDKKEKEVKQGEKVLSYQKNLLNERARSYYKNISKSTLSLISLLAAENLSTSLRNFTYQKSLADEDRKTIIKIVMYIKNLEEKKASLQSERERLTILKLDIDKQSQFLAGEVASARKYQGELQQKIATLTARQQQLISQRLASLNIPRSAGTSVRGCVDDRDKDPGFSPRVAFFTYGAPHRNGLNQYGAWGRAKDGQNEEQILQAYYPSLTLKKDYDQGAQINVEGHGNFSIEDYTKRIYEVPDYWTDNNLAVLKAQAVAARTYALNSMQRKGSICTTEACQVFKPEPKGGNWEQAVNATAGWVLMDGGSPGFTQYASTHGGYILNLGKFDGRSGNPGNFGELNDRAYDKESPWFYCDWGARSSYGNTAWLKINEVADIVNAILLARSDSSTGDHLYQTDKPHPYGGEVWSEDRVKQELRNRGISPYSNVSDVSVGADFNTGLTSSVNVLGDAGSQSINGGEFKNWFNLRAPANIQIVGPLYNVEKR
ncbi:hypothetical protein A3C25_05130 [Candidatus Roizmanbacteria bacterium RIFCSPHIGHO2_02_FULL_38_11]|uniref:Sporulation stage II protein D amidase enhancer LytB N-terminal domain-containing protein n=1 Tax=Candidatus Roizmanbacteria bacterium RIFCSPHIGHO2_02_FULL_38_11 TaxID=1802039 RepID=A0A1F7GY95_9BACT|nr:MAG: hypothetical protein A3C25_05130 [Candidatus Roizmanbacteria bacterium RIFCSPHIGHO2_02_FULL_38_11]